MSNTFKWSALIFLASLTVTVKFCRADILFIDMDDAPEEIAAAQRAAAARGEKLVIFPQRTPAQQKILNKIHQMELQKEVVSQKAYIAYRHLDAIRTQLAALQKSGRATPDVVAKMTQEEQDWGQKIQEGFAAVEPQVDAISAKEAALNSGVTVNESDLQNIVNSYKNSKNKLETIIFSGHHDYDSYTGALGSISQGDVVSIFNSDPDIFNSVKSVYGWGCYSATPAEQDYWAKMFPNLELLGGYDAGAPAAQRPADAEFLQGLLEKEAYIRRLGDNAKTAHDAQLIARAARAIPGFDMANTALCTRAVCVGVNTGAMDLSKQTGICTQKNLNQLVQDTTRYEAVATAQTQGCENVPCDGQHSWLRTYYNHLRSLQHCGTEPNMLQPQYFQMTSNADTVIRLIDFKEIYANFNAYYKDDIAHMQQIEKSCGLSLPDPSGALQCTPPPDQDTSKATITRQQILSFVNQLASTSSCKNAKPAPGPTPPVGAGGAMLGFGEFAPIAGLNADDTQFMKTMEQRYFGMVESLQCIPLNWVNPPVGGQMPGAPNASCADQGNYQAGYAQ